MNRPLSPARSVRIPRLPTIILSILLLVLVVVVVAWLTCWILFFQPVVVSNPRSDARVSPERLAAHVRTLSEQFSPRSSLNAPNLERAAVYIADEFRKAGAAVDIQEYAVGGRPYRNVIASFGRRGSPAPLWVVGAHYDAFGETPGADDNASGVAGLIELARLLALNPDPPATELVAYGLEEPPHFRTATMGSAVHAGSLRARNASVRGAVILEMIGYFSDEPGSQSYPIGALRAFYPSRGNFIALVGNLDQRKFVRDFKAAMQGTTDLPVYSINAPASMPGIDFSDHLSYWAAGIPALMVTDTAFYRNREYHKAGDRWDRLDYDRMADVVTMVYEGITND